MRHSTSCDILIVSWVAVVIALFADNNANHRVLALDESHMSTGAEFREVLDRALKLESDRPANSAEELKETMLSFASSPKSSLCEKYFAASSSARNEYLIVMQDYLSKLKTNKDVESSLTALNELSKFDPVLNSLTQEYQAQAKSDGVSVKDLRCAMIKYLIANLDSILILLQTDIKYLLFCEDQDKLNAAIHQNLVEGQTLSNRTFYNVKEFNDQQKGLVLRFFSDNMPGFQIDNVNSPGKYVIGRLLDTCQTVVSYQDRLLESAVMQLEVCDYEFGYNFDQYDAVFEFCHSFIDDV